MASVRMSGKLREQIVSNGNKIFDASDKRARDSLAKDFHNRAASEYTTALLKTFNTYTNFPDEWISKVGHVSFKITYELLEGTAKQEMSWNEMGLQKTIKVPKLYGIYRESYGGAKILDIPITFTFSQELSAEVSNWRNAIRKVESERKDFINELKRILRRTNTLKQFLDTWPQGENLVPPSVLATLNEKLIRTKKEPLMTEEASVALSVTLLKRTLMS